MKLTKPVLACLLVGVILTGVIAWGDYRQSRARHEAQMAREVAHVQGTAETTLERYLTLILAMEALVHANKDLYGDSAEARAAFGRRFLDFAESLETHNPQIQSMQLAPGGVIRYMTQARANSGAMGHDLLKHDMRREQVLDTILRRTIVVSGPMTLIQGGEALIVRKAIFTDPGIFDSTEVYASGRARPEADWPREIDSDFWGFATLVIGVDQLYDDLDLGALPGDYRYALRGRHGLGAEGEVFWGDETVFRDPDVTAGVPLPDGQWLLAVTGSELMLWLRVVLILVVGWVLTALAGWALHSHREKVLARAEGEAKTRFLAAMSHEIRTPMNGIIGVAELLGKTDISAHQRNLLDKILANSRVLLRLVNDVLDYARIDANAMALHEVAFDPRRIAANAMAAVETAATGKGLRTEVSCEDSVPASVVGDDVRVQQILVNLLGNAVKFTETGSISLAVGCSGRGDNRQLNFSVSDTGMGISAKSQKKLFRPFAQASQELSGQRGGAGLGLVISRQLAAMMGGDISLTSVPGQGACFTFVMPLREAPTASTAEVAAGDVEASACAVSDGRSPKILIVDDMAMNIEIATLLLASMGYGAEGAASGEEAVNRIKEERFDVILMDRHMPGIDGLEAARRIRAWSGSASEPWIIAMTASAQEDERNEYLQAGANDFLAKPIDSAALAARIERAQGR